MAIINKKSEDDNVGGLYKLKVVPMSKLVAFPYIGDDGLWDPTLFETLNPLFTANTIEIDFKKQTASFDEEDALSTYGKINKDTVTCLVAKDYEERNPIFKAMRNERYLVLAWDNNLIGKVIGNITLDGEKQGAEFSLKKVTGDTYTKLNSLLLTFYAEGCDRAYTIKDNTYFGYKPSDGSVDVPPPEA